MRILVTGSSRGIGRGVVESLARRGHSVVVTARQASAAQALAKSVGSGAIGVELDIASSKSIQAAVAELERQDVRLDALVHNAAVYERSVTAQGVRDTLLTNVSGPIELTRRLANRVTPRARVVLLSSNLSRLDGCSAEFRARIEALRTTEGIDRFAAEYLDGRSLQKEFDPYAFSKALLNRLAVAWTTEHSSWTTVAVSPGWVKTDMGGAGAPDPVSHGVDRVVAATLGAVTSGEYYPDGVTRPALPSLPAE